MPSNESDDECYLLDEHALERCMADGDSAIHGVIQEAKPEVINSTSDRKEIFLSAFPEEKEMYASYCKTIPTKRQDDFLAGLLTDRLANQFNIDDETFLEAIIFICLARRKNFTIVTGDYIEYKNSLRNICKALDVRCIYVDEFINEIKK